MKRGTGASLVGLALLLVAVSIYAWTVWPSRISDREAVVNAMQEYEEQESNPKLLAQLSGPRTRQWMMEMIQAATGETRERLAKRGMLDLTTILELRVAFSTTELRALDSVGALEWKNSQSVRNTNVGPTQVSDVAVRGNVARARLSRVMSNRGGGQTNLELGTADFFSRENGKWLFEPWVLQSWIMDGRNAGVDQEAKLKVVETVFQDIPGFDESLWNGPRP